MNKIKTGYSLNPELIDKVKKLAKNDSLVFSSETLILESALHLFLSLPKEKQVDAMRAYLNDEDEEA